MQLETSAYELHAVGEQRGRQGVALETPQRLAIEAKPHAACSIEPNAQGRG